jgi:hypothetical protein
MGEKDALFPYFDVRGPDGEQFRVEMTTDRITIGRYPQFNDVALWPVTAYTSQRCRLSSRCDCALYKVGQ